MSERKTTPPIPTLLQVKTILGDRTKEWTKDELIGALAYVDTLAERTPPNPCGGHLVGCKYLTATGRSCDAAKGVLCTCDPERPR
jgi:hypothetical protein